MSGEDRQQFARDSHQRMLGHEANARRHRDWGYPIEAKHYEDLAARERRTRDRYDDAGEFDECMETEKDWSL